MLDVDVAGIKRVAGPPTTLIEVQSDLPVGQVIDLMRNAHVAAGRPELVMALDEAADVFLVDGPRLTPTGVLFGIDLRSYRDFEGTLRAWAANLEIAGLRGAIGPRRLDHPPFHFISSPTATPNLVAAMVFRTHADADTSGAPRQVPDDVRTQFLAQAQDWGQKGGETVHVSHGLLPSRLKSTSLVAGFVSAALAIAPPVSVHWSQDNGFRTIGWDHAGHAWLQVADRRPWFERLAELEAFIDAHAKHLVYASISLRSLGHLTWAHALTSEYSVDGPSCFSNEYLSVVTAADEYQWVPKVSGSQLLGREHLSATHDLSRWTHTTAGDMTWVRASTPADWFANEPDSKVVSQARADFGVALLSDEQYTAAWQRYRERNVTN